jgi:hypothetical protein
LLSGKFPEGKVEQMSVFGELDDLVGVADDAEAQAAAERDLFSPLANHFDDRLSALADVRLTPEQG